MRHAVLLATVISFTGCATAKEAGPRSRPTAATDPSFDYVSVSRALTEIDAAERLGELADELRWAQTAERAPQDAAAQFLAVAAQPGVEDRWNGYRDLSMQMPGSPLPWVGMARTYLAWRTWDQAERAIAAALERDPGCWLAVRLRAELSELRGKPEAAQADFQAVLKADPRDPEAHLGLARLARAAGDKVGAHDHAAAALEETRSLPGAWALLAELSEEVGEPAAAVDFWKGAIEQAPSDRRAKVALDLQEEPEALAALADAARGAGDADTEQRALERLALLKPSAEQWKRVAEVRMAVADYSGAERALRRVLDTRPKDEEASLGMGRIRLARGDCLGAVEALRAAGTAGQAELAALEKRLNLERISRPDVNALQRAVQGQVDKTYRTRLAEMPALSGNLRVRVTVDGSGAATLVEVLEDSVHDQDVRACAYWNLHDASYPPDRPGRYSFTFTFHR